MEILMKLKCSPSRPGSAPHSTIKVVDHHNQLQQYKRLTHTPTSPRPPIGTPTQPQTMPPLVPMAPQREVAMPTCMEYTTTMECCNVGQQGLIDLPWKQQARNGRNVRPESGECMSIYENATMCCAAGFSSPCETPACCSGVACGMTPPLPLPPLVMLSDTQSNVEVTDDCNMRYEYHEPEENFVSIDDAKIKGFLMKIGQERARNEQANTSKSKEKASPAPQVCEVIDLDDEEEREKLYQIKARIEKAAETALSTTVPRPPTTTNLPKLTKSPDISLIPKVDTVKEKVPKPSVSEERIIAQIDLLDSSDSEANDSDTAQAGPESEDEDGDDDDAELVLAAAAVTCELECDDDDEAESTEKDGMSSNDIVVLPSDDENMEFIDEQEEGLELRWDELEKQREQRTFYKCYICSKKVQSSYNLRRHMMIHTGERPFGCDMCDRRFREFSDLKKHRRRHMHETNFVCMVCRVNRPIDNDPTRCRACHTKNDVLIAAMRSQTVTPEKSKTPPSPTPLSRENSNNPTPNILTPASPEKTASPVPPQAPMSSTSDAQQLLDSIPAVHRRSVNQLGVITRKEFPCPLCQRPFGTRHNLKRHFMIHTGEKPFSCSKCRKPFREYSTMKKHLVTHQRDRWYKCLRCPQKYRDYLDYMEHKNTHSKEKLDADTCTVATTKKKLKTRHGYDSNEEDSSAEDWLECCECGQRYTDIDTYTEHLKEHDPSLHIYECYMCKKTFEERDQLVKHVAEHVEPREASLSTKRSNSGDSDGNP